MNMLWILFVSYSAFSHIANNHSHWISQFYWILVGFLVLRRLVQRNGNFENENFSQSSSQQKPPPQQQQQQQNEEFWRKAWGESQQNDKKEGVNTNDDDPSGVIMVCALFPTLLLSVAKHCEFVSRHHPVLTTVLASVFCLALVLESEKNHLSSLPSSMIIMTWRRNHQTLWYKSALLLLVVTVIASILLGGPQISFLVIYSTIFFLLFLSLFSIPSLHQVWTMGEWLLIVSLLTVFVVHHGTFIVQTILSPSSSLPLEATVYMVARSGFLATLLACPMILYFWPYQKSTVANASSHMQERKGAWDTNVHQVSERVGLSVVIILVVVELHLRFVARLDDDYAILLPQALVWLVRFLMESETSCFFIPGGKSWTFPRYYWIGYWSLVLFVNLFGLPFLWEHCSHRGGGLWSKTVGGEKASTISKSWVPVTLVRKWFHWVAVLLFLPPTIYAPQMQALSYAIALSILVLVEGLHIRSKLPSFQIYFDAFLDPSKNEEQASTDKIVVSHLSLILGCAMPLYLALYLLDDFTEEGNESFLPTMNKVVLCRWLSMLGIVGLGVGDAAAAVFGTFYSRLKREQTYRNLAHWMQFLEESAGLSCWGRLNRTWIGSLAMLCSMHISVLLIQSWFSYSSTFEEDNYGKLQLWPTLLWLTVVEAYTSQLDNLVLPLVGMTAFLQSQ